MLILIVLAMGLLSSTTLMAQSPVDTSPCLMITGGFLRDELSPQAAIEKARVEIWLAYDHKQATCVSLNLIPREGHSYTRMFRIKADAGGALEMSLDILTDAARKQSDASQHHKITKIQRLSTSTNRPTVSDDAGPATYRLRLFENDQQFVDI